jgi:hypothetical protein
VANQRAIGVSGKHSAHDTQGAFEWVEDESQHLKRDSAQESFVAGFAEDHRCMAVTLRQRDMAFGDRPFDISPVR